MSEETIEAVLENAGFENVEVSAHREHPDKEKAIVWFDGFEVND